MKLSRRVIASLVLLAFGAAPANAVIIGSEATTKFKLGFGAAIVGPAGENPTPPGTWTTNPETNASFNIPTTTGNANGQTLNLGIATGFTLKPVLAGRTFSNTGVRFTNGVLVSGGDNHVSGASRTFEASFTGTYDASLLPDDATNVQASLVITNLSIWGVAIISTPATDQNNFRFFEVTPDHGQFSAPAIGMVSPVTANSTQAGTLSNYKQLTWDPGDFTVLGVSSTRTFQLTDFGVAAKNYIIDGFSVEGYMQVSYEIVPEPSSFSMMIFGLFGLLFLRRK